ncbi:uncharacterized protein TRIVIDRAFT_78137 [Trichoderma virens Gv29-8]|uniref:Rhodopsin domain-containing protein n=1 Tax=Hypocrea virens (strain Gv29-8 / FGSC 10586) TaxID=413071 RepID=G9N4T1_HYPVG|nr:uncharacterized protein TRIVIDRAFT_78137 [Trichoderma virens Gv29-8]EHK18605.1 hypothetical protein TRIVIDRAFT_78137 [Trichoderma virens Gv29-8]UKZ52809.1 hypothetical protein TrVGV298_006596 [Trichoderma virens]UKZ78606.1 hypothetical protein TrVFT333_006352 [Trichoderma virens FT-333]
MDPETSKDGSSPFSRVTFNDHSGQLWILTILSLLYSFLGALTRAYIKYRMFGFDDLLFASATVLHLAQSIAVFVGLNNGLGKFNSITPAEKWATSSKSTLAAVILCLLSLSFAKCSVLALIHRIIDSKTGMSKPFCIGLMILSSVWGVGSCLAFIVNCRGGTLLTLDNVKQCPNQNVRWAVITAIDILTEILTWLFIVWVSWTVNMSFSRKFQVALAFSFRLPLIAFSALHLAYFSKYPTSPEPQFAVTNSLLFQQTMIVWSLISATVPNMKNFLKSFSIGLGFPLAFDSSVYASSNAYPLRSLENSRSKATSAAGASTSVWVHDHSDGEARGRPHSWRPDHIPDQTTAKAYHFGRDSRENLSEEERSRTGSRDMIITKEVAWKVTHEDRQAVNASSL